MTLSRSANRPFGTIAGMSQYKHASVATFEGYAGSSAFRAEVENQRALGQLDDMLAYFEERQTGSPLSGPAAPRISNALDTAAAELAPPPAMIADRARLRTMLASLARTLHVGVFADCFFDPGTAICLKQATKNDRKMTPLPANPLPQCLHHRTPSASMVALCGGRQDFAEGEASVASATDHREAGSPADRGGSWWLRSSD
ncbi:hypothetical protein [Ensifer sp. SSB1]|jgi:hypothetical protein|uniref:hypothetical protein n=1 Tax=Ensifer sp. SSB1 TaxID=2795385 RepID=UPI0025C33C69|nr:hypothetical protein [Ensifer sp. SSB1]